MNAAASNPILMTSATDAATMPTGNSNSIGRTEVTADSQWTWWQNALAGNAASITEDEPQTGYYRVRRKGQDGFSPVAYWIDSKTGKQRCHLDGKDFDEQRALEIWPYASKQPVRKDAYDFRLINGHWPDEHVAVVGHNKSPVADDIAALKDRIADLAREAEKLIAAGAAQSDTECNQASDLAQTFGELEGKISRLHKDEKEPHLEAGRAVDRKWFGLRDRAAELKRRLKLAVVTPFLAKKVEATEKADAAAVLSGADPATLPNVRLTAGSSKRSTALRTRLSAEITDWDVLLASLKTHPEIRETAQRIADASAKARVELPGTRIIKSMVAA
jgi:hypothetical protein